MQQNIPLAIGLVVIGSFCFASSAAVQHHAVGDHVDDRAARQSMTLRGLGSLLRHPRWWAGLGLLGVSAALQILALTMAPVSVVQPVGLLAFPWSVVLGTLIHHSRVPPTMQLALAVTVLATLGFTVVTGLHATSGSELHAHEIVIGALVVYATAVALSWVGQRGPRRWRCLFWASAGALFYGLEAALVKALLEYAKTHDWRRDALVWAIVAALVVGSLAAGALVQQGYATGPAEVVVGSMTVTSPVVAVLYGFLVLGEGERLSAPVVLGMLALGAVAVAGVAALSRFHPDSTAPDPVARVS